MDDNIADTALRPGLLLVLDFTTSSGNACLSCVGAGAAGCHRCFGVSAVPEFASLPLLLTELGLVGDAVRRRLT